MKALPVIVGFGGINAAGRASFHHGYQRMVFDALSAAQQQECEQALSTLMKNGQDIELSRQQVLDGTLIRKIEATYFDVDNAMQHKKITLNKKGEAFSFTISRRDLPATVPAGWQNPLRRR